MIRFFALISIFFASISLVDGGIALARYCVVSQVHLGPKDTASNACTIHLFVMGQGCYGLYSKEEIEKRVKLKYDDKLLNITAQKGSTHQADAQFACSLDPVWYDEYVLIAEEALPFDKKVEVVVKRESGDEYDNLDVASNWGGFQTPADANSCPTGNAVPASEELAECEGSTTNDGSGIETSDAGQNEFSRDSSSGEGSGTGQGGCSLSGDGANGCYLGILFLITFLVFVRRRKLRYLR